VYNGSLINTIKPKAKQNIKITAIPFKVEGVEFAGVGCALSVNCTVTGSDM